MPNNTDSQIPQMLDTDPIRYEILLEGKKYTINIFTGYAQGDAKCFEVVEKFPKIWAYDEELDGLVLIAQPTIESIIFAIETDPFESVQIFETAKELDKDFDIYTETANFVKAFKK